MSIILQVSVKIFLEKARGKFLLLKRSPIRYPTIENSWDIPGGRINTGISLKENLIREVQEETGLKIIGKPKLLYVQDILKPEKHIVRITFVARTKGRPRLNEEHVDFRWLSIDEVLKFSDLDEFAREVLEKNIL